MPAVCVMALDEESSTVLPSIFAFSVSTPSLNSDMMPAVLLSAPPTVTSSSSLNDRPCGAENGPSVEIWLAKPFNVATGAAPVSELTTNPSPFSVIAVPLSRSSVVA